MAPFIFYNNGSSSSVRIYMATLIILVLTCSFSYGSSLSSSLLDSSNVDINNNMKNFDIEENLNKKNNYHYRLPFRSLSSSIDDLNSNEKLKLSKNFFRNLLLQTINEQEEYRPEQQDQYHINNRRYAPQSFHAMRG